MSAGQRLIVLHRGRTIARERQQVGKPLFHIQPRWLLASAFLTQHVHGMPVMPDRVLGRIQRLRIFAGGDQRARGSLRIGRRSSLVQMVSDFRRVDP